MLGRIKKGFVQLVSKGEYLFILYSFFSPFAEAFKLLLLSISSSKVLRLRDFLESKLGQTIAIQFNNASAIYSYFNQEWEEKFNPLSLHLEIITFATFFGLYSVFLWIPPVSLSILK